MYFCSNRKVKILVSFIAKSAWLFVLCFSLFSCKESTNDALKQEDPIKEGDLSGYYAGIFKAPDHSFRPPYNICFDMRPYSRLLFENQSFEETILGIDLNEISLANRYRSDFYWHYDENKKEVFVIIKNNEENKTINVAPWKVVRKKGVIHLVVLDDQGKIYRVFKQIKPMPFDESDFIQQSDLP